MVLMSAAGFIWLQPLLGIGPDLKNAEVCLGEGVDYACHATPGLDVLILPIMFISGALMISERRLSKLKHGLDMILSIIQMICLLVAIIWALIRTGTSDVSLELGGDIAPAGWLFFASAMFAIYYVVKPQPPVFAGDEEA